jgi:hypothetical protein
MASNLQISALDELKAHSVEMYDSARYFTWTGKPIPGLPATINDRDLKAVHAKFIVNGQSLSNGQTVVPQNGKDNSPSAHEFKAACGIVTDFLKANLPLEEHALVTAFKRRVPWREKHSGRHP